MYHLSKHLSKYMREDKALPHTWESSDYSLSPAVEATIPGGLSLSGRATCMPTHIFAPIYTDSLQIGRETPDESS